MDREIKRRGCVLLNERLDENKAKYLAKLQGQPTVPWIYVDDNEKRQVNIPKLGKDILAVYDYSIAEHGNKEEFYEYNHSKGYWELRNIRSVKSAITELLNKQHVWTDRVARDAFHFVSDSIK